MLVDELAVPDFRGWHAVEAWVEGTSLGLACQWRSATGGHPRGVYPVVAEQAPPPGTVLAIGSIVALFVRAELGDPGGPGGVREPRRPLPPDRYDHGEKPLPTV